MIKRILLASAAIFSITFSANANVSHSPYVGLGIGGVNAQHSINVVEDLGGGATEKNHEADTRRHGFWG